MKDTWALADVSVALRAVLRSRLEPCVIVYSIVAKILFYIANDLPFCGGSDRVPTLGEDPHPILSKITANQIQTKNGVEQSVTHVDGHCM